MRLAILLPSDNCDEIVKVYCLCQLMMILCRRFAVGLQATIDGYSQL
jgi:hypothetical protein